MGKPPNVNEYPAFRIIYFTFLSALRIVFFSVSAHTDMLLIGNTLTRFTRSLAKKYELLFHIVW